MIDTLRILVTLRCNLDCSYCCNNLPSVQSQLKEVTLDEIDFSKYRVVCITGGEPLLDLESVERVCQRVVPGTVVVLYTNGYFLTPAKAALLESWGVTTINVGLHQPSKFDNIIIRAAYAVEGTGLKLRLLAEDQYHILKLFYPSLEFRFWKMNDCDRENEDRVVLKHNGETKTS